MTAGDLARDPGTGRSETAPEVDVVLPVFRNRAQLPELHRRLGLALRSESIDYALLFVEDAGGDDSLAWLLETASADPRMHVVALPTNMGQHRAVLEGLRVSRSAITVVMDADLQDPPEQVPALVRYLRTQGGVVAARRTRPYQSSGRHLTGQLFKRTLRWIAGGIPPGTGMFLAMTARTRERVVEAADERPYIPLLLARTGAVFHTLEVPKDSRPGGGSAYSPWRRLVMGARAMLQAIRWRLHRPGRR